MTRGASSLQRRLTLSIVGVVGLALAALSITLSVQFASTAWTRFDERLAETAGAAAAMVDADGGAPRLAADALASLDQSRGRTVVQVWAADGSPLGRFPEGQAELPRPAPGAAPLLERITLPDGRPARLYRAWLQPHPPTASRVAVALARDVDRLEARLTRFRTLLWGSTLAVVLLAAAVVSLVVRGSLRHLARLSESIAAMSPSSLGPRLELHGLPDELRPPFVKLDELLSRVEASLARERQFSADVSHELRTPLAGLRAILEVSASRDRPGAEYRASLGEALEVVHQVEAIVEDLLLLARLGAGQAVSEQREVIPLRDLVEACFAPHADAARRRGLRFEDRVPKDLRLTSERLKLRLVLANLLSNAVEYTAEGGWITVESAPSSGLVLAVRDSGPAVPEEALDRLFDPFFRLDGARSGGGAHSGVGLALVRGLCHALGHRVEARNEADGSVTFAVTTPAPARLAGET